MSDETEDGFVDFDCPACEGTVSFPDNVLATAQSCPLCMQTMVLPPDASEQARMVPLPIRTPRLVLRRFQHDDWKSLLDLLSDEELLLHTDWSPLDEEESMRWLERDAAAQLTDANKRLTLAMEAPELQAVIGSIYFGFADETHLQGYFGLVINRRFHRQGFGLEAVRGLIGFAFNGLYLHRLTTRCDSRNVAACALVEKAGMRREAEFRENREVNGEWVSTVCFGLLEQEFQG